MRQTHEDFSRVHQGKAPSHRAFGWTWAALFALVGLWPLVRHGPPRWWSLGLAALLVLVTALVPALLGPPSRLWHRFGLLLHRVVSPIVLALMFFLVLTPMGLLMRVFGRDMMRQRSAAARDSYWIERNPPGPEPGSLARQF